MLTLTRRKGETIHIGEGVVVQIAGVDGKRVRVSITAPPEVRISRGELLDADPRLAELHRPPAPK